MALVAHFYLLIRHRTWYFTTVVVGTVMEVVGYVFRILSSEDNPYSVPWFVVQYFFIVVAPVMFSAAIYAVVSVLINTYGIEYAPMPPKVVLGVFITCDVVATVVQVAGAALVGVGSDRSPHPGSCADSIFFRSPIRTRTIRQHRTTSSWLVWPFKSSRSRCSLLR